MPVLMENSREKYRIKCLWKEYAEQQFNMLFTKKVFRDTDVSLVTGNEHGIVKVYNSILKNGAVVGFGKDGRNYETKGDSIQTLKSHNVTNFSSNDILLGDTNGLLTIITNGQILNRRLLCDSDIKDIVLDTDSAGNTAIIVGSRNGVVVAVTPYDILWKFRLSEVLQHEGLATDRLLSITAMFVFRVQSSTSDASYLLIADSEKRLHVFHNERLVLTLAVPSIVTNMCSGFFINEDTGVDKHVPKTTASPGKPQKYLYEEQVAMATTSGAIFVLVNFNVIPYANLSFPVTKVTRLPASGVDDLDAILCCGHFNKLCILQNGCCVSSFPTSDWIHSLDLISVDYSDDDAVLLVAGGVDRSIQLLQLRKNR